MRTAGFFLSLIALLASLAAAASAQTGIEIGGQGVPTGSISADGPADLTLQFAQVLKEGAQDPAASVSSQYRRLIEALTDRRRTLELTAQALADGFRILITETTIWNDTKNYIDIKISNDRLKAADLMSVRDPRFHEDSFTGINIRSIGTDYRNLSDPDLAVRIAKALFHPARRANWIDAAAIVHSELKREALHSRARDLAGRLQAEFP